MSGERLKGPTSGAIKGGESISGSQDLGRKRSEVHITWDEQTIAEHDKLRGTRQKIDEPSTPYHYGSGESSQGSDCESADGKGPSSVSSTPTAGTPSSGMSPSGSPHQSSGGRGKNRSGKRGSILKVIEDVSAALPSESALRRERQARWDSDVSENSATEDKEKARKFKARREAHYNEFRALREWKRKNGKEGDIMADDSDSDSKDMGPDMPEERRRRRAGATTGSVGASSSGASSAAGACSVNFGGGGGSSSGAAGTSSAASASSMSDGMDVETDEDIGEKKCSSAGVEETKSSSSSGFGR